MTHILLGWVVHVIWTTFEEFVHSRRTGCKQTGLIHLATLFTLHVLGEPRKTERTKIFMLSKCQIFVNKMFQNNLDAEIQLVNHSI